MATPNSSPIPLPQGAFSPLKILVIDDQVVNCKIAKMRIKKGLEASVEIATSGREAIQKWTEALYKGTPFHLLLTDIEMPGLDGIKLTKKIKELAFELLMQSGENQFPHYFPEMQFINSTKGSSKTTSPCPSSPSMSKTPECLSPSPTSVEYKVFARADLSSILPYVIGYSGNEGATREEAMQNSEAAGMCGYIAKDGFSALQLLETIEKIITQYERGGIPVSPIPESFPDFPISPLPTPSIEEKP